MKTVGIYVRVSKLDQHPENQERELRRIAEIRNWTIFENRVFTDHGISGAKGEDKRPALKELMDLARRHKIHVFMVWEFSRFARSTKHLLDALDKFRMWNVDFVSVQQNADTTTASGRMLYGVIAVIAEYEREQIRERVLLGLDRAKSEGKKLGPPTIGNRKKRKAVDPREIVELVQSGMSCREVENMLGVGKSTVARYAKAALAT